MAKKPSPPSTRSSNDSARLPDLGTLWMHSRYGLCIYLGAVPFGDTGFGSSLYTVYVLIVRTQHNTEGIFSHVDWHEQFAPI